MRGAVSFRARRIPIGDFSLNAKIVDRVRTWPWRWILFIGAFGARLVYVLQGWEVPAQDTPDYDEIALNLLGGEGFVARENWFGFELRSWRPPFYPFFLALVYGVWDYSHTAVRVAQAAVGAGAVLLVYELGRRLRPKAALVGGFWAAVYGPLVVSSNEVMSETWFTFWLLLAAWLLVAALTETEVSRWHLAAGGVAAGLAALTRPVGLILLPAFVVTACWRQRREGAGRSLWVALALCCTILPWSLRNYQVHGAWVPISTHGGFILARSNALEPAWRQERGWGIAESFFQRIPSEVERDRFWYRQGLEFIRSHPGRYLRLAGERFLRFWYFLRPDYNFWFMAMLPFFLAGLWRFWRTGGFLLLSSFAAMSLGIFCFVLYGSTRFRLPLEPFFLLFAAAFVQDGWARWGGRRMGAALGAVVVFNLLLEWNDAVLRELVLQILAGGRLK